jgi:integrase
VAAFWQHAETYYRRQDGTASPGLDHFRYAIRPLRDLYGSLPAAEFSPKKLKAIREWMIAQGQARSAVNDRTNAIKSIFDWAVEQELAPAAVSHSLRAVKGLRRGRSEAREIDPVAPVAPDMIEVTRNHVSRQVQALIDLQLLTGARPGESVVLRRADIDTSAEPWKYKPLQHKTAHHDQERIVRFGPKAHGILSGFLLDRAPEAFLFSPAEAERERLAALNAKRKTRWHRMFLL